MDDSPFSKWTPDTADEFGFVITRWEHNFVTKEITIDYSGKIKPNI